MPQNHLQLLQNKIQVQNFLCNEAFIAAGTIPIYTDHDVDGYYTFPVCFEPLPNQQRIDRLFNGNSFKENSDIVTKLSYNDVLAMNRYKPL